MPFFLNRRLWLFLLLDTAVLLALMGLSMLAHHGSVSTPSSGLSERILSTPTDKGGVPGTPQRPSKATDEKEQIPEAAAPDSFDLKRLRSKTVTVTLHQVKLKENYWIIAKNCQIDVYTLIGANPNLPFKAEVGQYLNILSRKGTLHIVSKDDDLAKIAKEYKSDERILQKDNDITWWHRLHAGDVIFVPDVLPVVIPKEWRDYFDQRGFFGDPLSTWGKWTSVFGWRNDPLSGERKKHKGMDLKAKYGDRVYAAAGGRVIFAGVSGGYGNLLQVRHNSTYTTYYGHLSKILVKQGQKVRRGTLIGRVGATGHVTGPHLHFEIRKNGKAINPLPLI